MIFPSDDITEIPRERFYAAPPDYDQITDKWEYEDGGCDFNEVSDNAPRRWEYNYVLVSETNTDPASVAIFDDFYNSVRKSIPFNFTDKYGKVWTNVYIEEYSRTHEAHKPSVMFVKFKLINYDGIYTIPETVLTFGGSMITLGDSAYTV